MKTAETQLNDMVWDVKKSWSETFWEMDQIREILALLKQHASNRNQSTLTCISDRKHNILAGMISWSSVKEMLYMEWKLMPKFQSQWNVSARNFQKNLSNWTKPIQDYEGADDVDME